ncbi:response regulator [Arenibaculum sp.]|jgi:DNA-binding response OmpR family regulator|uniref:response regulator n=1 Tax=Arenibaculum sp. TaxID=2865862 RepID=UPI002E13F318|nr:response regulator [Arenibaculum sp.]
MNLFPLNLLILGDDLVAAFAIRQPLEAAGHRIVGIASSLAHAMRVAQHQTVHLALVDVHRDRGSDGVEAAHRLSLHHGVATLFVTCDDQEAMAAADGALGCLDRPFSPAALLAAVEAAAELVGGRQPLRLPAGLRLFPRIAG